MRKTLGMALFALATFIVFVCASAPAPVPTRPAPLPAPLVPPRPAAAGKDLTLDLGGIVSLKLVRIPAGKFQMGSPLTEKDRNTDELPHTVTISKPFYLGVTHVTVNQFTAFVNDSDYKTDAEKDGNAVGIAVKDGKITSGMVNGCSWRNPSFVQKGDHPVVQVSWNDAQAFCNWLAKKSGKTVTLPTEAQWEYACRAGTKTTYPWGDNPDDGKGWANCADLSLKKTLPNELAMAFFTWDDGFDFTSPGASFKANAFGLYDMIGNAWQWCQDRYGDYGKAAVTDPAGPAAGTLRVLRGGSWYYGPKDCRAAHRTGYIPTYRFGSFGFRVAATVD